jgi:hypothetical protein
VCEGWGATRPPACLPACFESSASYSWCNATIALALRRDGQVRATLRAAVFTAVDEQERAYGIHVPNQKATGIRDTLHGETREGVE